MMSYCRWSCDNHQSDVYAYEHVSGGFVIHVATSKDLVRQPNESPYQLSFIISAPKKEEDPEGYELWLQQHKARQAINEAWSSNRVLVPIGLPHDGETIRTSSEEEMFQKLKELKALGYHVPEHAFETEG